MSIYVRKIFKIFGLAQFLERTTSRIYMQQAYIIIGSVFNFKNKNFGIDRARSKLFLINSSNARLNTTIYYRIVKLNELTICAEQFYGSLKDV